MAPHLTVIEGGKGKTALETAAERWTSEAAQARREAAGRLAKRSRAETALGRCRLRGVRMDDAAGPLSG
jgi:hypothetical protein